MAPKGAAKKGTPPRPPEGPQGGSQERPTAPLPLAHGRVGAPPRHRLRATAGAAHRHPSPQNGRGRQATTSPKEEAAPAHKPKRTHGAKGNP